MNAAQTGKPAVILIARTGVKTKLDLDKPTMCATYLGCNQCIINVDREILQSKLNQLRMTGEKLKAFMCLKKWLIL